MPGCASTADEQEAGQGAGCHQGPPRLAQGKAAADRPTEQDREHQPGQQQRLHQRQRPEVQGDDLQREPGEVGDGPREVERMAPVARTYRPIERAPNRGASGPWPALMCFVTEDTAKNSAEPRPADSTGRLTPATVMIPLWARPATRATACMVATCGGPPIPMNHYPAGSVSRNVVRARDGSTTSSPSADRASRRASARPSPTPSCPASREV